MSLFASVIAQAGSGGVMGKGTSGVPMIDDLTKGLAKARELLASKLPAQSLLGRTMRSFNSADGPLQGLVSAIGSLFGGRKYRSDEYRLGEKYMLYVLGIDIHSYRKVEDSVVPEARHFFSTFLGIYIDSILDIDQLKESVALYKEKGRPSESDEKLWAAHEILKKLPFNDQAGAWISPIIEITEQAQVKGSVIDDITGTVAGLGISRNTLVFIIGAVLLLFLFRRK